MTTPDQFLAPVRPEPKRDRWGRYLIPLPDSGKEVGWTRATTFAGSVADKFGIGKWQTRQAAVGLARRADLLAAVASVPDPDSKDGKRAIDDLCEQAAEAAGANVRRTLGTALHSFTEAHDLGRPVAVPAPYDADVAAYAEKMAGLHIDHAHVERIVCIPDIDNDTWIKWASPVWYGIAEMATLNPGSGAEDADERHICPLQLPLIERCVRLWSNPGETVLSPFAGIGSEGYVAVQQGRKFIGCELKPSYWRTAIGNLEDAEAQVNTPSLFDETPA